MNGDREVLGAALRRAVIQWEMYANEKRGPHAPDQPGRSALGSIEPFDYIATSDEPEDLEAALFRECKAALTLDTARDSRPVGEGLAATAFDPWTEVQCTQMCVGWKASGDPVEAAQDHARESGHETAVIRHHSTHYRRSPDA